MERIQQGLATTISFTFEVGGAATNPAPDSATVQIFRADGSLLTDTTPATDAGTGIFTYTLSPTETAQLDVLRIDWTATVSGVEQTLPTHVEVAGGFYFTIGQFKAAYATDQQVQDLSVDQIQKARQTAEEIIERACDVSFVPRGKRITASGDGGPWLPIPLYRVRRISAYSIDGTAGDLTLLTVDGSSLYRSSWPQGFSNVALTVEHGYDEPPAEIRDAAMTLTYHRAVKGPIDDRAIGIPTESGVIALATPGLRGAVTGLPGVDQAIEQYAVIPGVA